MTNINKLGSITLGLAILSAVVVMPIAVHADDGDYGGGYTGGDIGGGYTGGGDIGGGYTGGDVSGGYTGGDVYVPNYTASYTPDYTGSYTPDYTGSYTPDYTASYTPDYTSTYAPDYTGSYTPDYAGSYTPDYSSSYTPDYATTYVDGVGYSYAPSFSVPTSIGGYQTYSAPSFSYPSTPVVFNAPTYRAPTYNPPTYNPPTYNTPVRTQTVTTPTNITNVNNNTNNNTNNNNININNNSSAIAIATVTPVAQAPVQYPVQYVQPNYYAYAQPSCSISINHYNGNSYGPNSYNQLATLTWSSQNATSGYISPSVGSVSGYGSMQVYPTNGQMYTMTVYGQGGSATCVTQPLYTYVAPIINNPTPYVSLSQIPYTGFDFGTLGNSIYWLSLMVFAGAAAYLVLYFNGGALALVGQKRTSRSEVAMPKISVTRAPALVAAVAKEEPVLSPIQLASSRTSTSDTMHVKHSKAGETPRIYISRE